MTNDEKPNGGTLFFLNSLFDIRYWERGDA